MKLGLTFLLFPIAAATACGDDREPQIADAKGAEPARANGEAPDDATKGATAALPSKPEKPSGSGADTRPGCPSYPGYPATPGFYGNWTGGGTIAPNMSALDQVSYAVFDGTLAPDTAGKWGGRAYAVEATGSRTIMFWTDSTTPLEAGRDYALTLAFSGNGFNTALPQDALCSDAPPADHACRYTTCILHVDAASAQEGCLAARYECTGLVGRGSQQSFAVADGRIVAAR